MQYVAFKMILSYHIKGGGAACLYCKSTYFWTRKWRQKNAAEGLKYTYSGWGSPTFCVPDGYYVYMYTAGYWLCTLNNLYSLFYLNF